MSINGEMDEVNVACGTHNGIFCLPKGRVMFLGKWMELYNHIKTVKLATDT